MSLICGSRKRKKPNQAEVKGGVKMKFENTEVFNFAGALRGMREEK